MDSINDVGIVVLLHNTCWMLVASWIIIDAYYVIEVIGKYGNPCCYLSLWFMKLHLIYFTFQDSFSLYKYYWVHVIFTLIVWLTPLWYLLNSSFCSPCLPSWFIFILKLFFPLFPFTSVKTWLLNPVKVENFLIK